MPDLPSLETLFVRLYLDRHIMARLAVDLRAQGFNVLRTEEAGKDRASDEEQLAFAAQEGRSILPRPHTPPWELQVRRGRNEMSV